MGSTTIECCRSCGGTDLKPVLDLGKQPLADRLLNEAQLKEEEPAFPLEVVFCPQCSLMQITETVDPEILFSKDYPYFSSFSDHLLKHSRENVLGVIERQNLNSDSLIIELASNDGYLLKNYVEKDIPVLGIDPADGPVKAARENGVDTLHNFFSLDLAKNLKSEGRMADVIHGNNVLAHVADTNGFVEGIAQLLKEDGVAVIEAPYVRDLIDHCEFDTIYHQHLLYLSVTALDHLFRAHSLYLNEVKELEIHGGSLRLYVNRYEKVGESVQRLLKMEQERGIDRLDYYVDFSQRVQDVRTELSRMLRKIQAEGKTIAAYGAAAKGCTLLNFMDLDKGLIDFVVDRNVHKQGLYMTGQHSPILPVEALMEQKPDYVLMLPWNFADEILKQQQAYREQGGKFIIPIPSPKIV